MQKFIVFAVLNILCLSALVASVPLNGTLDASLTHTGRGTWYNDGLGACGHWDKKSDTVVALSRSLYGPGNPGDHCGQYVQITANGHVAYGIVHDKCMRCGEYDLDMSIGLFTQLGDLAVGVLEISWQFMPEGWHLS